MSTFIPCRCNNRRCKQTTYVRNVETGHCWGCGRPLHKVKPLQRIDPFRRYVLSEATRLGIDRHNLRPISEIKALALTRMGTIPERLDKTGTNPFTRKDGANNPSATRVKAPAKGSRRETTKPSTPVKSKGFGSV